MLRCYQGSCHCGRVRFEVDADIDHVRICDCSLCRRRGALNFRVSPDAFRLLTELDDLSVYRWNTNTAVDYFCPECGIQPFRRPRTDPTVWTINARCIDEIDLDAIAVEHVFGSRLA